MQAASSSRGHRGRWIVLGGLVAVVGAVAAVLVLYVTREDPDPKDVDEAVDEYRATSVAAPSGPADRPEAGVYEASGHGREELSFPPLSQDDGATMPLTVEHLDEGCWRVTIDFNEAHWQRWDYCTVDGRVLEQAGETFQRWDLGADTVESLAEFECDPPNVVFDPSAQTGDGWDQSCTGINSAIGGSTETAGTTTYLGSEVLEIDGASVPVAHYRQDLAISGAQEGTNEIDTWHHAGTGLPVRMERTTEVATDSPVGAITYHEAGEWQLTSLVPVG